LRLNYIIWGGLFSTFDESNGVDLETDDNYYTYKNNKISESGSEPGSGSLEYERNNNYELATKTTKDINYNNENNYNFKCILLISIIFLILINHIK
jgi:hypothetical protein